QRARVVQPQTLRMQKLESSQTAVTDDLLWIGQSSVWKNLREEKVIPAQKGETLVRLASGDGVKQHQTTTPQQTFALSEKWLILWDREVLEGANRNYFVTGFVVRFPTLEAKFHSLPSLRQPSRILNL